MSNRLPPPARHCFRNRTDEISYAREGRPKEWFVKPVVQQELTGCAIASVAAIAGLSYSAAKAVANSLGISATDPLLWSDTQHIRKLLVQFNRSASARFVPFRSWDSLPNLALLATKWHLEKGCPVWHWAVFVREGKRAYVLDSKKSLRKHRRTDFGRIKPKWYIAVT